jgi:hypothetical protein
MSTAVFIAVCASGAAAQVPWDSPFLAAPRATPGVGLYLADVGGLGALLTYQPTRTSWGLRFGVAEGPGDDVSIFGGGDFSGIISRSNRNSPLDVDWVFGVGLGLQNDVLVSVPAGVSLGHTFPSQGATFTPYITPRLILDAFLGDGNSDTNLDFAVDLGLDLRLQRSGTIRFGATIGDREAIAIGLVF